MKTKKEKPKKQKPKEIIQTEQSLNWEDNFHEKLEKRNKERFIDCLARSRGLL